MGQEGIAAVPDNINLNLEEEVVFFLRFSNGKGSWIPFSEVNDPRLSRNYTTQFKVGNIFNYS